jgi:dihydroorotate dehydrogenase (NAD+) catalytic subunit
MIMAGATAVGVGSAVWQRGPQVFNQIVKELAEFMENEQYIELAAMRGIINR